MVTLNWHYCGISDRRFHSFLLCGKRCTSSLRHWLIGFCFGYRNNFLALDSQCLPGARPWKFTPRTSPDENRNRHHGTPVGMETNMAGHQDTKRTWKKLGNKNAFYCNAVPPAAKRSPRLHLSNSIPTKYSIINKPGSTSGNYRWCTFVKRELIFEPAMRGRILWGHVGVRMNSVGTRMDLCLRAAVHMLCQPALVKHQTKNVCKP